uniref:Uncharacterized protein n=1 Tax=Cacopsylla melanoneura TaxID=428564 RepID=A0A8D9EVZ3_9HEMI
MEFSDRRLQKLVSLPTLKNAYYGLFHSILSYGILLWGHSSYNDKLFILQKKAIRILDHLPYNAHAKQSFIKLDILTFPSMFILHCLLYIKKNPDQYTSHSQIHHYETRNRDNLVLNRNRVNASRNGPNYHAIPMYNKIPPSIREMPLKPFKIKITEFLKKKTSVLHCGGFSFLRFRWNIDRDLYVGTYLIDTCLYFRFIFY